MWAHLVVTFVPDDACHANVTLEAVKLERFADELDLTQVRIDLATEAAVAAIRRQTTEGQGRKECIDCGAQIPVERLLHVPNATRCIVCQDRRERRRVGDLRC